MGQRLVAVCILRCCGGLTRKLPALDRALNDIEIVRFYTFAPAGSSVDRYTGVNLCCGLNRQAGFLRHAQHEIYILNCHAGRAFAEVVEPGEQYHMARRMCQHV